MDNKIKYPEGKIVCTNDSLLKERYRVKAVLEVIASWCDISIEPLPLYLLENIDTDEEVYCLESGIFPYIYTTAQAITALNEGKRVTVYALDKDIDKYTFYIDGRQQKILNSKGDEVVLDYHTINSTNHWYIHKDTSHRDSPKITIFEK